MVYGFGHEQPRVVRYSQAMDSRLRGNDKSGFNDPTRPPNPCCFRAREHRARVQIVSLRQPSVRPHDARAGLVALRLVPQMR